MAAFLFEDVHEKKLKTFNTKLAIMSILATRIEKENHKLKDLLNSNERSLKIKKEMMLPDL